MKRILRSLIGLGFAFALASTAYATPVNFQFHFSGGGNVADLNLTGNLLSGTSYHITAGSMTVTAGGAVGSYTLFGGGPTLFNSPSGNFIVDNVLNYNVDPSLNNGGLLFTAPGVEINIWGNGAGDYSFYQWTALGGYDPAFSGPASFTGSAVPEPASLSLLVAGIASLYAFRKKNAGV